MVQSQVSGVLYLRGSFDPFSLKDGEAFKEAQRLHPAERIGLCFRKGSQPFPALKKMAALALGDDDVSFLNEEEAGQASFIADESVLSLLKEGEIEEEKARLGQEFRLSLSVITWILAHRLYFVDKVLPYYKNTRYQHALRVSYTAYKIAMSNRKDACKAFLAGYYHDITRMQAPYKVKREVEAEIAPHFQGLTPPSWIYHQFTGAIVAKEDFHILDEGVLSAIRWHTTGRAHMTWLEKTVFAADKIEPGRKFDSKALIKAMEEDIDMGFLKVLKANVEYLDEHVGKQGYSDFYTKQCLDYYLRKDAQDNG